ncbi:hypothetical protein [Metabacillus halosaccharovorans]|uniref:YfhE family protein n=1 Tax=Metabacillus halosaccharovorans TaxID=930124 RepID=A0ABT3DCE1_9BACI|nr:hypothetical protein [Metabacillus halosaccharovorans]MCV9884722.1 hypothetical protein [Metabacillus halosaccharovorans]
MDFSNKTNKELYEIAKNEKYRMKDRYAAARELQKRREKGDK